MYRSCAYQAVTPFDGVLHGIDQKHPFTNQKNKKAMVASIFPGGDLREVPEEERTSSLFQRQILNPILDPSQGQDCGSLLAPDSSYALVNFSL